MVQSLLIGIGLTLGLVLLWTLVQAVWKKVFRDEYFEEDVLAGRRSCSNCGCTTICVKRDVTVSKTKQKVLKVEK